MGTDKNADKIFIEYQRHASTNAAIGSGIGAAIGSIAAVFSGQAQNLNVMMPFILAGMLVAGVITACIGMRNARRRVENLENIVNN